MVFFKLSTAGNLQLFVNFFTFSALYLWITGDHIDTRRKFLSVTAVLTSWSHRRFKTSSLPSPVTWKRISSVLRTSIRYAEGTLLFVTWRLSQ